MSNESWMKDGFSGVQESLSEQEARFSNKVRRVWVKPCTSLDLIFLDDRAVSYDEHTLYVSGDYISFTCIGAQNGCPKCLEELAPNAKKTKYRATAFSVIDTGAWTDKRGKIHTNEKKLYIVKEKIALIMQQAFQRFGGFKGKMITVTRTGKDDFATGSGFSLAMQGGQLIQPDWTKIENKEPFDYAEVLKPLPFDQIAALMRQAAKSEQSSQGVAKNASQPGFQQPNNQQVDPNQMTSVPF